MKKVLTLAVLALSSSIALAGTKVTISTSATNQIKNDIFTAVLYNEVQGENPNQVAVANAKQLKQALDNLDSNSKVSSKITGVSVQPIYKYNGKISGWTAHGELTLESKDSSALSEHVAKTQKYLMLAGVHATVSIDNKALQEDATVADAYKNFEKRANQIAQLAGKPYKVLSMRVDSQSAHPMSMGAPVMAKAVSADVTPLPINAGETTVQVTVSGEIELAD